MKIGAAVLYSLGASEIIGIQDVQDPTTESEFLSLQYTCSVPITWTQYQNQYPIVEKNVALLFVRQERNVLLQLSDWLMTSDVFQTLENKNEWIQYRQLLRDFPSTQFTISWNIDGTLNLSNISWPQKPAIVRTTQS